MHQGSTQRLNCTYQMLLPGQLLSCDLKPLLMQLEVCPPQLVHLMSNFNTLALPACSQLHNSTLCIHVITERSIMRVIASLLAAMTGGTGVTTFGLITRKP